MAGRIPVTVVSGFLGSGKTSLLNRLLRKASDSDSTGRIVVLMNELGDIGLDHERVMQLDGRVVVVESGCICCAVQGDLVQALRQLFLDALHKEIPPFSAVWIETTGIADPAPVMYTLRYERFLSDRYVYAGCLTVVDGQHGLHQLQHQPEAAQQVALADVLAISKSDVVSDKAVWALEQTLRQMNPSASVLCAQNIPDLPALQHLLHSRSAGALFQGTSMWSGRSLVAQTNIHSGVGVLVMKWPQPWERSRSIKALSALLASLGESLLRLKGRIHFREEKQACLLHAVHQQLYPLEPVPDSMAAEGIGQNPMTVVLFIYRGLDEAVLVNKVGDLLPEGQLLMSPAGNFIQ